MFQRRLQLDIKSHVMDTLFKVGVISRVTLGIQWSFLTSLISNSVFSFKFIYQIRCDVDLANPRIFSVWIARPFNKIFPLKVKN